jgi:hypothetical protein
MDHAEHLNNYRICNDKPGITDSIVSESTDLLSTNYTKDTTLWRRYGNSWMDARFAEWVEWLDR